jgi:hypothetical protein
MNRILDAYARAWMKEHLALCTEPQRDTFIRIFAHTTPDIDINAAVDAMRQEKLDSAMMLINRTVDLNNAEKAALSGADP